MTLETIYYIGQTIAVVAILASLIFVGKQMRDGNRLARAQMHQQISDGFTQLLTGLDIHEDDFYEAMHDAKIYRGLSRGMAEKFNAFMLATWKYYENVYYQHKHGFVANEYWRSTTKFITVLVLRDGVRFWWEGRKATFAQEFVDYVDSLEAPDMPLDMKQAEKRKPDETDTEA